MGVSANPMSDEPVSTTHASNLSRLQERLRAMDCHGLLIPSTDEYLSEFTQPFGRRLEWATGFHGSTGLAAVLQVGAAALFLDGRYKAQGERDASALGIEVHDAGEASSHRWLAARLKSGQRLAIDTRLQPYCEVERTLSFARKEGIETVVVERNPVDELWGTERPAAPSSLVIDYPMHYAGLAAVEKIGQLCECLEKNAVDCHLVADPEDVAWLLNVRTLDSLTTQPNGWHRMPIPLSRLLVEAAGRVFWFIDRARLESKVLARLENQVTVVDPNRFEADLAERAVGRVLSANLARTPHRFAAIASWVGTLKDDPIVAHRRWKKNPTEIQSAREGHHQDGLAVIRFMAWVQRAVKERVVTELEASQKLTEFRSELKDYKGLSMPLMSAGGESGAIPHYVPTDHSNRKLNDHPIYWMDSGGQYYGCSTDNTVCITVGQPEKRHVEAHTLVVKGLIALSTARFPTETSSTQLDSFARQYLWQQGMDYAHATGHGVGSFMNIHEGPHIRKEIHHPMVGPIEAGVIVSNEPAYYSPGDFGIRVESHMVARPSRYHGFLEFETLSRLPIDPQLIDEARLSAHEKRWLADYHAWIGDGYKECLDKDTARWLQGIVDAYAAMVSR